MTDRTAGIEARPWLIWSNERGAWWRENSQGYTCKIGEAGRYTKTEAYQICLNGGVPRAGSTNAGPYEITVPAPEALAEALDENKRLRGIIRDAQRAVT